VTAEEKAREPIIEILDETEHLEVLTELPGVEEANIQLEIAETKITISAADKGWRYHGEIFLRVTMETTHVEKTFTSRALRTKPTKK